MNEAPHPAILNRQEAQSVADQHFAKQTALLRDLANYGSNLVIRAFESSPKKMAEVVICGVLLKQIVAMADACEVLLTAGCGHAAFLPARAAFEASIYIDLILSGDSERRATRYVVANYRDERLWASRATPGTAEELAFMQVTQALGVDIHANRPTLANDASAHLKEVDRILAQPSLAAINQEFITARGKRKRDPEWYELDGIKSIRQVADTVGRSPEYDFFYAKGSQVAHTGTYKDHVRFADGQVVFKPVRHLADVNMLLNFIVSVCVGSYKRTLERYRPGETTAFTAKYVKDWREPFMNATPVKYNF